MAVYEVEELMRSRERRGEAYLEFLRVPALSCGVYSLPAGAIDPQSPHTEDEVYYVVRGRARIGIGAKDYPVRDGSVVFVPAGAVHRFHSIEEDLTVLVTFAPTEGSGGGIPPDVGKRARRPNVLSP